MPCQLDGIVTLCLFLQEPSLYTVKAILILDNDGDRLFAKVNFYKNQKEKWEGTTREGS